MGWSLIWVMDGDIKTRISEASGSFMRILIKVIHGFFHGHWTFDKIISELWSH